MNVLQLLHEILDSRVEFGMAAVAAAMVGFISLVIGIFAGFAISAADAKAERTEIENRAGLQRRKEVGA